MLLNCVVIVFGHPWPLPNESPSQGQQSTEDTRSSLQNQSVYNPQEDAVSSAAESVPMKSASTSDIDSSEEEEGGERQGPHKKNGPSAHSGG